MCTNFYFKFSLSACAFFLFEDFFVYFCSLLVLVLCLYVYSDPANLNRTIVYFVQFNVLWMCILFAIAAAAATVVLCVFESCMRFDNFILFTLLLDSVQFIGSKFIVCQYGLAFKYFFSQWIRKQQNRQVKNTHSYLLADLRMSFLFIPFHRIYKLVAFFAIRLLHILLADIFFKRVQSFKSLQFARTNRFFPHAHIFNQWICKNVNLYGNFNFPSKNKWFFNSFQKNANFVLVCQ